LFADKGLEQWKEFGSSFDLLAAWMTSAEEKFGQYWEGSRPSSYNHAQQLLDECRSFQDELANKSSDLDRLSAMVQNVHQGSVSSSRVVSQINQLGTLYFSLGRRIKVEMIY
jgi:Spectrin repeat